MVHNLLCHFYYENTRSLFTLIINYNYTHQMKIFALVNWSQDVTKMTMKKELKRYTLLQINGNFLFKPFLQFPWGCLQGIIELLVFSLYRHFLCVKF